MPRKPKQNGAVGGQSSIDAHCPDAVPAPPSLVIDQIRYWHRQRCFAMEQRKRIDLALGSFLRLMLGWRKDLPESERKAIADRAADAMANDDGGWEFSNVIAASRLARGPFEQIEARSIKEMTALAVSLPAWSAFGESVRGFGAASLAVIVAEAGDLSSYANPGKLWKRMGLAVMGDVRQGGLPKNASAEDWIAHGYNRQRRSRMWNIGDALIKGNRDGEYRKVYLDRKAYELARDPEMKPIKAHRRAQRYMEKRLLKNLWQAWRRANLPLETGCVLPDAESEQAVSLVYTIGGLPALRSAIPLESPMGAVPSASIPAKAGKRRATRDVTPKVKLPAAANIDGAA